MAWKGSSILFILAGLLIVPPDAAAQDAEIVLEEILSYGEAEFPAADSAVAGGAAFGFIERLSVDERYLYVLDRKLYKITVFDKESGIFARNILGGEGRGPGEFRLPIGMTLTPDHRLAVYDYENRKISFFDTESGEDLDEIGIPMATRSLAATGDRIWMGSMHRDSHFLYSVGRGDDPTSVTDIDSHVEIPEDDLAYTYNNSVVTHANVAQETGELYFTSPRPTLWYAWSEEEVTRYGREAYPGAEIKRDPRGITYTENQALDICSMNGRYVVVLWMHMSRESEEDRYWALDFYERDGTFLGRHIDREITNVDLACEDRANVLYLSRDTPHLRVVKYRVLFH